MCRRKKYEYVTSGETGPYPRANGDTQTTTRPRSREKHHPTSDFIDPDRQHSESSLSLNSNPRTLRLIVGDRSMASTEYELETSNSSISDVGQHQPPTSNKETLRGYLTEVAEQNTLSLAKQFEDLYHVKQSPKHSTKSDSGTASSPVSVADSKTATPHPAYLYSRQGRNGGSFGGSRFSQPKTPKLGPDSLTQYNGIPSLGEPGFAPSPSASSDIVTHGEEVYEARPSISDSPATDHSLEEDFELVSDDGTIEAVQGRQDRNIDYLCVPHETEKDYMTLIPYYLGSAEPPKLVARPSEVDLRRVTQLRQNVRRLRLEIQNLKFLLQAKDQYFFNKIEETLKFLREFVVGHRKRTRTHVLISKLFAAYQSNRNECGPLIAEIGLLEERLALEDTRLSQAEDSLHKSFGIPLHVPEHQENQNRVPEFKPMHSPPTSGTGPISDDTTEYAAQYDDADSDSDSVASSIIFGRHYHPLYVQYEERRGQQDILYERYAHLLQDKARLEGEKETRESVGLSLQKDDETFLQNFTEITRPLDRDLEEAQRDIELLKAECLERGIIDEDSSYIYDSDEDSDDNTPPPPPPPHDLGGDSNDATPPPPPPPLRDLGGDSNDATPPPPPPPLRDLGGDSNNATPPPPPPPPHDLGGDSNAATPPPPPPPLQLSEPPAPREPTAPPAAALPRPITVIQNSPPTPPQTSPRQIPHSYIGSTLGNPVDEKTYQSRINPWLLEKLTASKTELALLTTILSAMDTEPDVISILDVLRNWEEDGAGFTPPQRPGTLDEETINRLRRSTRVIRGDGYDRELVKALFGLSLWGDGTYANGGETAYLEEEE